MKTHEKTLRTMGLALALVPIVVALLVLVGCESPTAPTAAHPNELLIAEYVRCYAEYRGVEGHIVVRFEDDMGDVDCSEDFGAGARCSVAGRAMPYSHLVTFWGAWVRGETEHSNAPVELALAAAHEACHLSGIFSEEQTGVCARLILGTAGCFQ